MFFENCLFMVIKKLVCGGGGPFEGFATVIQGDNSVPHQDAKFKKYVVNFCKENKWLWEPQGPQMPHINVLDIAVFPVMSRCHSHFIRSLRARQVEKEEDIWKISEKVWEELPSCKITNEFYLAKINAEKL